MMPSFHRQLECRCSGSLLLAAMTLVVCGCNAKTAELAEVRGTVEFDGKPLTAFDHAAVVLTPHAGRLAKGVIGPDGSFRLSTYANNDGAVVGQARVSVSATVDSAGPVTDRHEPVRWVIPKKFGNADTSGLTCEVNPGVDNILRIQLNSNGTGTVEKEEIDPSS